MNSSIDVQLEDDGPYRYARFYDVLTNQPFLGEASVVEKSVLDYISVVRQDIGLRMLIKRTLKTLAAELLIRKERLKSVRLNARQVELLGEFKSAQRSGDLRLSSDDITDLIDRGYLRREPTRGGTERRTLEEAIARAVKNREEFDPRGNVENAERCRAKVERLRRRLDALTLVITDLGRAAAKQGDLNRPEEDF